MAALTIGEVAAMLHSSPSTIRSWEQRLGFPTPSRAPSGRRLYDSAEIALLSDALRRGLTISSAVREIRAQTGSHDVLLRTALQELDFAACDSLLEAAITLRGASRAFDETVLAAVEGLVADDAVGVLAHQWAQDRACWARRYGAAATLGDVLIVDGSSECSTTRVASCILQLQLALRSVRTHALIEPAAGGYSGVARSLDPTSIVFVGAPPAAALRGGSITSGQLAAFRTSGEHLAASIQTLPRQPRVAAEQILRGWEDGAATTLV